MIRLKSLVAVLKGNQTRSNHLLPVEATDKDREIIDYVSSRKLTMVSVPRLWSAINAVKYVIENDIDGDIIECGTWRGGCALAMKMTIDALKSPKKLYILDTFAGMTAPTDQDLEASSKQSAEQRYNSSISGNINTWCYASLEDVRSNFANASCLENVEFVKGDVLKTLKDRDVLGALGSLSVVRLDTDWYESTKIELETLYPRLSSNGILLIDDYGHWEGARKAVDEYFVTQKSKPLSWVIDYTGRGIVKN